MGLVNKELIANELKRRIDFCNKIADASAESNLHNSLEANELLIRQFENLLYFLNSLEVKEADLEKEIELVKGDYEQVDVAWNNDFDYIAKHFFELGLQARKGK